MIRIVCCSDDSLWAANVGTPINKAYKTFDVELPEIETWLKAGNPDPYDTRTFVGIEILDKPEAAK